MTGITLPAAALGGGTRNRRGSKTTTAHHIGLFSRLLAAAASRLDRRVRWHRLPKPLGMLALIGLRTRLRERNLHDTGLPDPSEELRTRARDERYTSARTLDGTLNDLEQPQMGSVGTRFGRNVPLLETFPEPEPEILDPNPRVVSLELLTRERFVPVPTLNVLAAAWIQFEVHDWFSHGIADPDRAWELPLAEEDRWPVRPMRIARTRTDPTGDADPGTPPTFATADSHWWDGSQIYGSDARFAAAVRANEDGKLRLDAQGLLPRDLERHVDLRGVQGNFWVGLGVLHTLFTREHNAICDRLRAEHPSWSDDRLYEKARLVNAALMAKIHTVEWTPAIIAHPTTRAAMRATWWGLAGKRVRRRVGRLSRSELLSGIPGSETNHHGVPFALTEEFVAVYRMHPLLPDDYVFRSLEDDRVLQERSLPELAVLQTRERLEELGVANALYSLGIAEAGALTLHNYPRSLQLLERPDGTLLDLAAVDVMRIREHGVPRYNRFRQLVGLPRVRSFEELTDHREWAEEIRRVYDGDIDRVDLMIGLYAEPKPRDFGFSDTAFRVFLLMASRRLLSDRFFTRDYTEKTYTRAGLAWIDETSLSDVIRRHYPELAPSLQGVGNAFRPWVRVAR